MKDEDMGLDLVVDNTVGKSGVMPPPSQDEALAHALTTGNCIRPPAGCGETAYGRDFEGEEEFQAYQDKGLCHVCQAKARGEVVESSGVREHGQLD
jgi:hypothetical protein